MPPSRYRRVRFVCVSDTHNTTPKLPAGDVLIHAGDLTNQGSLAELKKSVAWLEKTNFQAKVVVAGNHDLTLDQPFYEQYGSYFHNQSLQDTVQCKRLIEEAGIHYLQHAAATIPLSFHDGSAVAFRIFGSPYSPSHGLWAFGYEPEQAEELWKDIPSDVDIVVTHTPPKYHRDEHSDRGSAGCEALRQALWRVRPRLHVCGHIHEGRGAETVRWDVSSSHVLYKEYGTVVWDDKTVGTMRQFKVDLTNFGGPPPIVGTRKQPTVRTLPAKMTSPAPFPDHEKAAISKTSDSGPVDRQGAPDSGHTDTDGSCKISSSFSTGITGNYETCIVNAAIIGSNWPHRAGKKFNTPVVVDIDFPITSR